MPSGMDACMRVELDIRALIAFYLLSNPYSLLSERQLRTSPTPGALRGQRKPLDPLATLSLSPSFYTAVACYS